MVQVSHKKEKKSSRKQENVLLRIQYKNNIICIYTYILSTVFTVQLLL